jgi:hypothetical protein
MTVGTCAFPRLAPAGEKFSMVTSLGSAGFASPAASAQAAIDSAAGTEASRKFRRERCERAMFSTKSE